MKLKHIGLFEGIGGFSLAAKWAGWETVAWCEWNEFGQKILKYYFPESEGYGDITKTNFTKYANKIDILTVGFPCQPYSSAGKRLGKEDDRHLWPEMLRAIREIKPRWIVGENVLGLVNWNGGLVFEEVQSDLENEGYEVQPYILPAASVGAPHRRDRVWFVAYSNGTKQTNNQRTNNKKEREIWRKNQGNVFGEFCSDGNVTNSECVRLEHCTDTRKISEKEMYEKRKWNKSSISFKTNGNGYKSKWENFPTVSPICTGNDGISNKLDGITFSKWRNESIKAGGNAIVPQVAYQIFKTINKMCDEISYKQTI